MQSLKFLWDAHLSCACVGDFVMDVGEFVTLKEEYSTPCEFTLTICTQRLVTSDLESVSFFFGILYFLNYMPMFF
jgi:hypothetical protein